MILTVVGSSSGLAVRDRAFSCLHLIVEESALLIDVGEGTTHQLLRLGLDPLVIREVWITHCHTDHAGGLMGLLTFLHLSGRTVPLTVYLPPSSLAAMENALEAFHIHKDQWRFPFAMRPITTPISQEKKWCLHAIENHHLAAGESVSLVFEKGNQRLLITSDVDRLDHLSPFARNAEILMAECTHVPISETLALADSHGIRRVYLTHIPPEIETTSLLGSRPPRREVYFVHDGDRITF